MFLLPTLGMTCNAYICFMAALSRKVAAWMCLPRPLMCHPHPLMCLPHPIICRPRPLVCCPCPLTCRPRPLVPTMPNHVLPAPTHVPPTLIHVLHTPTHVPPMPTQLFFLTDHEQVFLKLNPVHTLTCDSPQARRASLSVKVEKKLC